MSPRAGVLRFCVLRRAESDPSLLSNEPISYEFQKVILMLRMVRSLRRCRVGVGAIAILGTLAGVGCAHFEPFDSEAFLRNIYVERLGAEQAAQLEVPFELGEEIRAFVAESIQPAQDEERRTEQVQEFIFDRLGLQYSLSPTFDAVGTYYGRRGNCLSFVNLFVGIARELRLNPFYVEVTDLNRWNYRDGMVVSQGHIVAGMRIDGKLQTFDFLPYRPKSYKEFKPIDDVTASAHFYNNLAAESLMNGDIDTALRYARIATKIAPEFDKALNNLGVTLARLGEMDQALEVYRRGLEVDPQNVAILSNMVRAYQQTGRSDDAAEILEQLGGLRHTNPFFFIYQGELALASGDLDRALESMKKAFRRDSEIPEVHVGLAKVYLALGDLELARHHIGRALKLDATHSEALKLATLLQGRVTVSEEP